MLIRDYVRGDAGAITRLFFGTIRSVNRQDYSDEQVQAWAPEIPDADDWHGRMIQRHTLVAEEHRQVVAFAELESDGHVDMFYCRKDVTGRGIGRQLYQAVEARAMELGIEDLFAEVSITARPFFERVGFGVLRQQTVVRLGVELTNYSMAKRLVRDWYPPVTFKKQ